jgi:hypothetical protein
MKRSIILLVLIYSTSIYSQEKDSIIYIFPDKVEQKLYEQMKELVSIEDYNFEFYLQTVDRDKFRLTYSCYRGQSNNYWVNNTNRFVLINGKRYPLILDYDSLFGTNKPKEVGEYGHREGFILRSLFIYEGYNITFDRAGECLSEDWGIYEKRSN